MKIYIKSLLKLIKSNLSRFITLILIVFLGIGFLVGIFGVAPDLETSADNYYKDSKMSELYLVSTTGFLNQDLDKIEEVYDSYNPEIRPTYEVDKYLEVNSLIRVGHLIYTDLSKNSTDILKLESGLWPQNANEVVVERSGNYLMNVEVGSTISFDGNTYKVSGIVSNSWYMMKERYDSQTLNASLDTIVYLPINYYTDTFNSLDDVIYTNIYLYFGLDESVFSSKFQDLTTELQSILSNSNFEANHNNLFKEYMYDEALNSQEFKDNYEIAYDEALNLGYHTAIKEMMKQMYDSDYGSLIETLVEPYDEVVVKYDNGEEINLVLFTLSKSKVEEQFENKTGDIYDNTLITDFIPDVPEGSTLGEYIDSKVIPQVEQEVTEALTTATKESVDEEYDKMDKTMYYLDSLDNYSTSFFQMNVNKVEDVAIIFPIFFFIIASLVALTSLRRLVFEERVTMGTLRGLGYSKFLVLIRYIIYGILASAIGSVLGICLGIALIPAVVYNIFNSTCHMPPLVYVYDTPFISSVILGMIAVIVLVVILSVYSTLKETPANLLVPKAPKPGRRIFLEKIKWLWNKLSFKYKSSIRNMIRYKRNLIMMIIGVGGCTALLLLAFGLQDSMDAVSNKQYDNIILYDALVAPETGVTTIDNSNITSQTGIYYDTMTIDDYTIKVVGADESINNYFGFDVKNKDYKFTSDDVLLSKMVAENYDLKVGDTINYNDHEYTITGIFENYIDNYLFIGSNKYQEDFTNNRILINFNNIEERDLTQELLDSGQIISIEYVSSMRQAYNSLINNIKLIVVVIIIFAVFLAVVVIFNLMNINISERKRELATLKVLGYRNTEVHGYIARETFVLTLIGMLVGIGLGVILHQVVASIIDTNTLRAGRNIYWPSYLYAIGITLIISICIDLCFIPYYKNISMTDSLKAIE